MKTPELELEALLRGAPQPPPPASLRERLIADIPLPAPAGSAGRSMRSSSLGSRGWLAQWWPVLATACLALTCAVVFAVQQAALNAEAQTTAGSMADTVEPASEGNVVRSGDSTVSVAAVAETTDERAEIQQLRTEVARLRQEIAALEGLGQENAKLKADLAAAGDVSSATAEMAQASAKALSIQCINNLKQLGLAARIWAVDHGNKLPPDFASMSAEMSNPKILVCPADSAHVVAAGWDSLSPANISYEYVAANGSEEEPSRVAFRCHVHGHVGLCDGSVQGGVAKTRPNSLVWRDGKLYCE